MTATVEPSTRRGIHRAWWVAAVTMAALVAAAGFRSSTGALLEPLGVSPDGTQVFFRQPGRVEVWDLPSNTWRTVDTPDEMVAWTRGGTLWLPGLPEPRPDPWPSDHQYGPADRKSVV